MALRIGLAAGGSSGASSRGSDGTLFAKVHGADRSRQTGQSTPTTAAASSTETNAGHPERAESGRKKSAWVHGAHRRQQTRPTSFTRRQASATGTSPCTTRRAPSEPETPEPLESVARVRSAKTSVIPSRETGAQAQPRELRALVDERAREASLRHGHPSELARRRSSHGQRSRKTNRRERTSIRARANASSCARGRPSEPGAGRFPSCQPRPGTSELASSPAERTTRGWHRRAREMETTEASRPGRASPCRRRSDACRRSLSLNAHPVEQIEARSQMSLLREDAGVRCVASCRERTETSEPRSSAS